MGVWDTVVFGSDEVADFCDEVRIAVAAAALVAIASGATLDLDGLDVYGPEGWEQADVTPSRKLIARAAGVLDLVVQPFDRQPWSEPLWESAHDHDDYLREVRLVQQALNR